MAAAARAVQLETGAFPASSDELAEALGEARFDPCADDPQAPLGYRVSGQSLEVWESGENGVDDGGPTPLELRKGGKMGKKASSQKAARQQLLKQYGKQRLSSDDQGFTLRVRGG